MKYLRCTSSNVYTYLVRVGEVSEVLLHSTVEGEVNKLSHINQTCPKVVRKLQGILASQSDFDLANVVENNVVDPTPFTRRNIKMSTVIHSCDVAALKGGTIKEPKKMLNPN